MNKLIAHRGNTINAKENTIKSYIDAINDDYLGFECDVRETKDHHFIMYHNPIYKGKLIRSLNYNELSDIPTLNDTLNIDTDKMIFIDIKDPLIDTNKLINLLDNYQNKKLYIISFYSNILDKLNIQNRKYKIGLLNYILNTNTTYKYDFDCILGFTLNKNIINKYQFKNRMLVVYDINKENIKYDYPYYIVNIK